MKTKNGEMDFDFIGGQENLTTEEENQLTNYFKNKKSGLNRFQTNRQNKSSKIQIPTITN